MSMRRSKEQVVEAIRSMLISVANEKGSVAKLFLERDLINLYTELGMLEYANALNSQGLESK